LTYDLKVKEHIFWKEAQSGGLSGAPVVTPAMLKPARKARKRVPIFLQSEYRGDGLRGREESEGWGGEEGY
jgi:hypothetical protein